MEWSWRTVMILLGLVAMVAILIDGFRRMRRARAEALRLDVSDDFKFPEEGYNPELPGEVRVLGDHPGERFDETAQTESLLDGIAGFSAVEDEPALNDLAISPNDDSTSDEITAVEQIADTEFHTVSIQPEPMVDDTHESSVSPQAEQQDYPDSPLIPTAKPVNLDENVPLLVDVEELGDDTAVVPKSTPSSTVADMDASFGDDSDVALQNDSDLNEKPDEVGSPDLVEASQNAVGGDLDYVPELENPEDIEDPHLESEVDQLALESNNDTAQIITQPVNFAGTDAEVLSHRPPAEVVLVIHAIAQLDDGFKGSDLIYLFNSCDLRYGEKNIFHRFEEADGAGCIQFSVSQSHEPGTFEPGKMADQSYRGLSFFMSLPGAKRPLEAYEAMYEMAMVVSRNLKADVLDESLSALTPQTVEANREEIMTFERHQHLLMKKQGTR